MGQQQKQNIKTDKIPDNWGHYDLDGVSQNSDFDVIVASDKIGAHKPPEILVFKSLRLRFKRWVNEWREEE